WASSMRKFTYTEPTSRGWQRGSRLGVCLAAWIPATRATASTSPLLIAPDAILAAVSASMCTRHRATARRCVASLAVTSTMPARPRGSRWVNSEADMSASVGAADRPAYGTLPRSAADLAHRAAGADEVDLPDPVAGPLRADRALDLGGEGAFDIDGIAAHDRAQVELVEREQAGAQPALGRDPDAVAMVAERLGHARDHADVAPTVDVREPLGRLRVPRARHRQALQREHRVDPLEDLAGGDDPVGAPRAIGVEGHELDEPHADAPLAPK